MSNITNSLVDRCFLLPDVNIASDSQKDIIRQIMLKHNVNFISSIKLIDENDEYDSFLVEADKNGFCVKLSFDSLVIFYDFLVIGGLRETGVCPFVIDRGQIEYGRTIYYTIQSYEYSNNLLSNGINTLLTEDSYDFYTCLNKLHYQEIPDGVHDYLDDTKSYLEYHKINFENMNQYVEKFEAQEFLFLKQAYENIYSEMMDFFNQFSSQLVTKSLVHGNLNAKTIIENNHQYKFINFENAFYGSPFFDICNLVFEIQLVGINEHDFVTKSIYRLNLTDNRFTSSSFLKEYKVCKYIWTRKIFLDLIKNYLKEVIILNKTRPEKIIKLGNEFQKHFYRFDTIHEFKKNRDIFVNEYSNLILDK